MVAAVLCGWLTSGVLLLSAVVVAAPSPSLSVSLSISRSISRSFSQVHDDADEEDLEAHEVEEGNE